MKFSNKDFFSKCDQIRRKLWIWSHLLKKSLLENFIFCAMFKQVCIPSKFLVAQSRSPYIFIINFYFFF